jgi:GNAT superfamily N-acetyltransferase
MLLLSEGAWSPGQDVSEWFGRLWSDPERLALVGTVDQQVSGMVFGHVGLLPGGERLGHLEGYYVEPEARGRHLGHQMVDAAFEWFDRQGCGGVDSVVLPGDRWSKNLFESAGFKARQLTMHRPLGASSNPG